MNDTKLDAQHDMTHEAKHDAKLDPRHDTKREAKLDAKHDTTRDAQHGTKRDTKDDAQHGTKHDTKDDAQLALHGGRPTVSPELGQQIAEATRWPKLAESTVQACADMLRRGEISMPSGGIIETFENNFKTFIGTKHCLLQNNGTSTLHAAYYAVGVGPGDEVIVPSHTWPATVTPIAALGATPVFCDIDAATLTADPDDIERSITERTKAISIVHLWGNVCDMDRIMDISRKYGIPVIEDCSHAHGASYKGVKVGAFGAVGCFSLQGSKTIPGGELGAIVTSDDNLFDRIVMLGHQGRIPHTALSDHARAFVGGLGFKYRPFPLAVQIAADHLAVIEEINAQRRMTVELYNEALQSIPRIRTVSQLEETERGCYSYIFLYDGAGSGVGTVKFVEALRAEGLNAIEMRYPSGHTLPPFNTGPSPARLPVTEALVPMMVMLPPFTTSSVEDARLCVDRYAAGIRKVVAGIDSLK